MQSKTLPNNPRPPARRAPALPLLLREGPSLVVAHVKALWAAPVRLSPAAQPASILVIPGFLANDSITSRLRRSLSGAGHQVHGWNMGRNAGIRSDSLLRMEQRVLEIGVDEPVILIGWSLGGIIAREYAKFRPDHVTKVITLGTPFSGDMRSNNAWRLYERVAQHPVDQPPIDVDLTAKPPVHTVALWSKRDGVIPPHSAHGKEGETDKQLETCCTHMGMVTNRRTIEQIASAIA